MLIKSLSTLLPIITLIIGAFLVPTIQSLFEKRKRKESLKQELVKDVVKIYNYLSFLTNSQNQFAVYNAIHDKVKFIEMMPEMVDEFPVIMNDIPAEERAIEARNLSRKYLEDIVNIEADFTANLITIKHLFGNTVYKKCQPILTEVIKDVNTPTVLHDYMTMKLEECYVNLGNLNNQVNERTKVLTQKSHSVVNKIQEIIKL